MRQVAERGITGRGVMEEGRRDSSERRRSWTLFFCWVLACTVGGAAGGASYVLQFVGPLLLFGGIFGVAQWVVLRGYAREAGLWVIVSAVGWPAGTMAQVSLQGVFGGAWDLMERWTGNGDLSYALLDPVTWAVYGLAQCLALGVLLRSRFSRAWLWFPASVIGGVVWTAVQYAPWNSGVYRLLEGLGTVPSLLVTPGLGGTAYGLVTGVALVRVLREDPSGIPSGEGGTGAERPRGSGFRPGRGAVAAAGLLALAGLCVGGALLYSRAAGCSPEERAVFEEFPQYGGLEVKPESNINWGSCATDYETPDSREEVRAYFSKQLRANGWEVEIPEPPPETTPAGEPALGGDLLRANRDGYQYWVLYESLESYIEPRPGVHLAVHVSEG
jgi:hypothetical protein